MGDQTIESVTAQAPSLSLAQCHQGRKKILLVFLNIVYLGAVSVSATLMVVVELRRRSWVESLRYKSEVCGFDSRWNHWDFSLTSSIQQH